MDYNSEPGVGSQDEAHGGIFYVEELIPPIKALFQWNCLFKFFILSLSIFFPSFVSFASKFCELLIRLHKNYPFFLEISNKNIKKDSWNYLFGFFFFLDIS